jgi:hypothetical protein
VPPKSGRPRALRSTDLGPHAVDLAIPEVGQRAIQVPSCLCA